MTVLESLRCPSCSTRFGLSASRVHAGIRRAQCFRCDTVFGIEDAVARLLEAVPEPGLPLEMPSSLTLGDLDGAEDEIMEKTLVLNPPPFEPEPEPEVEPSPYATNGSNYSSARDAIAKLMGAAPSAPTPSRSLSSRGPMDVEATLDALDQTLSGAGESPATPAPVTVPEPPRADTASTVRLTSNEIQAALAAAKPAPAYLPPPRMEPRPPAPPASMEPTVPQDPNLLKIQLEQETCNNVTTEQMATWIEQGRVHEYHMVARQFSDHWIEASKVPALRPIFEQKRRRGQAISHEDMPIPPAEILPPKKSLFGGLFGRN
jgi:hypothetical protein